MEKEIDYFGFEPFELAEDLKETMSSLAAKYSNLSSETEEKGDLELMNFYDEKAIETHLKYEELMVNDDNNFVRAELIKYSIELKHLRA